MVEYNPEAVYGGKLGTGGIFFGPANLATPTPDSDLIALGYTFAGIINKAPVTMATDPETGVWEDQNGAKYKTFKSGDTTSFGFETVQRSLELRKLRSGAEKVTVETVGGKSYIKTLGGNAPIGPWKVVFDFNRGDEDRNLITFPKSYLANGISKEWNNEDPDGDAFEFNAMAFDADGNTFVQYESLPAELEDIVDPEVTPSV